MPRPAPRRVGERGAVTAELALGIPVLLVVTLALAWLLGVVVGQVRVVDAAREAARAVARGDPEAEAVALARRIAPPGARVSVRTGEQVTVTVTARIRAPGPVPGPGARVDATATALAERPGGTPP